MTRIPRRCEDCGADITERHLNTLRCPECAAEKRLENMRRYDRKRVPRQREQNAENLRHGSER